MVERVGRLFLGIPLSDEVRHGLVAHLQQALGERPLPGKPVVPQNWHLTLRFLGQVEVVAYEKLLAELDQAALGEPFTVRFAGLGAFPRPARATVLWLGVGEGEQELRWLAGEVAVSLERAGFTPEERPFAAHLTLSRIRPHQDVRPLLEAVPSFPLPLPVGRVVVFRSHLGGGPARYEELESFQLSTL
ncbi:MAG: RNA 2',3'-cyclic phosphodiesterase [Actinomycetota bacterium]|nr:RNA 2',3'-cyclic phosphodiesterase [Actinomycetota bacterium]